MRTFGLFGGRRKNGRKGKINEGKERFSLYATV
jgi:hypothetical protein